MFLVSGTRLALLTEVCGGPIQDYSLADKIIQQILPNCRDLTLKST